MMRLRVLTPTGPVLDTEASKVTAEGPGGSFTLLPRHIDFVSALEPGILSHWDAGGREAFLAVDEGLLVKIGPLVRVAVRQAVTGDDLGQLALTVRERFQRWDDEERRARSAMVRMEAGMVRRFMELTGG